jgi:hypothetical protein
VPIRTALFFVIIAVAFGLDFEPSGVGPALLALLLFIPFVWGLGVASGALTLTVRRGTGAFTLLVSVLLVGSGALLPAATPASVGHLYRAVQPSHPRR